MANKVIAITGSSKGIGFGFAAEFAKAGHSIVINGRNIERLEEAVNKLKLFTSNVIGIQGCIKETETHKSIIEAANSTYHKLDIWINNAGVPQPYKKFAEIDTVKMANIININIYGLILATQIAYNFMSKQGHGKIFNMEGFGSDGRTMDKLTIYGTSKRAVNYFTKSAAKEMKKSCVQIGIISPGMVRTDFIKDSIEGATPEEEKRFEKVYKILSEDVSTVAPFICRKILKSSNNYDRIVYLTKGKMMIKLIRMLFG